MKQVGSLITGGPSPEQRGEKPTGRPHGETGSGPLVAESSRRDMHPALLDRTVTDNTSALLSRMRSLGVSLSVEKESRWKVNPQTGEQTWSRIPIRAIYCLSQNHSLSEAKKLMTAAMAPASIQDITQWLAYLNVTTKGQNRSERDFDLMAAAYVQELRKWPGDVVKEVLTNWGEEWFPGMGPLKEALKKVAGDRVMLAQTIEDIHE